MSLASADGWSIEPVPAEAVAIVRASLDVLVAEVVAAVSADSPVYREVMGGPEGVGLRLGIDQAVRSFLDAIERGEHPRAGTNEMWRRLGEAEFQAGRGLEPMRHAFRTGTRAAWRGAAELAAASGVPADLVIRLAEAIFVYTDELAAEVVEGYLRMQSDEAGERERRRRRLVGLLLEPSGHDPEAIERAAQLARWPVPRTLTLLVLAADDVSAAAIARGLGVDPLVGSDAVGSFVVIGDPDGPGRRAAIRRAVADSVAALGPTVVARDAHRSLRWARRALALVQTGALAPAPGPGGGPVRVDEHLAELVVLQDEPLARLLVAERLAPLEALPAAERDRLLETLAAWLDHQRRTPGVAAALHVHPQTVRYRIGKLRELLGDALENPDRRFELEAAVRARRALAA